MKPYNRLTHWLESHWVNPAYGGWLMAGLALFFFGAATNTMAGWLYVISGVIVAILALAAVLPVQTLRGVRLQRSPINPVSVGEQLRLELKIENLTQQPKTLLQIQEDLPDPFPVIRTAIEQIPPQGNYLWTATLPTHQRGIYRWQTVQVRTAAPLGLFWCCRPQVVPAKAVVYPTVLKLSQCPIVDEMGQNPHLQVSSHYQSKLATEGVTRTLRPYRWGDSTRFIHWRSSARYGELRVRELETYTGGQELVIGLDSAIAWDRNCFEQAVIAAASLYFYGLHHQLNVSLWTAGSDRIRGDQRVLETLAGIQPHETQIADRPRSSLLWLTQTSVGLATLPAGSRWLLWRSISALNPSENSVSALPGLWIQPDRPLQIQLQQSLTNAAGAADSVSTRQPR